MNVVADDPEAQDSITAFKQTMQQLGWSRLLALSGRADHAPQCPLLTQNGHQQSIRCSKSAARPNAIARKSLASVAQRAQSGSTTQVIFMGYGDNNPGGSMSRAPRTTKVHDDAIIAFLLFCLEIYQAEQERKRKLH